LLSHCISAVALLRHTLVGLHGGHVVLLISLPKHF
jgi:hypothetical protein